MEKYFQDSVVDDVLSRTDIVQLISARLPLKKTGRNYKSVCPFHSEKTPSFTVSQEKQIYHCFGCGAGGNAISFLMKYDKLSFREALETLAEKAGVKLPARKYANDPETDSLYSKLYQLNEEAKNFFFSNLKSQEGAVAVRYLKNRGIEGETAKTFQLGYSLAGWEELINYFAKKNIDAKMLVTAGLATKKEDRDSCYDRFRNRIMFPIFDISQKVIGFGARSLDDSQPKYLNSPETPVYVKGKNLFGLNLTKGFIKEKGFAIIVEGYMDLIIPFQYGIKNIVATCGTALTPDQVRILKRFSNTAVILFDPDKAGEEASLRGLDLLVSMDMNVRIATLPQGMDPDTFVRKHGSDAFLKIVSTSKDLFDYKLDLLSRKYNKEGVRGRAAIATLMLPTISRIPNEVLKASFLKKLSQVLGIDEEALKHEMKKVKSDYSYNVVVAESCGTRSNCDTAEIHILSIILDDPDTISIVEDKLGLDCIKDPSVVKIIETLKAAAGTAKNITPGRLISYFEDEREQNMISTAAGRLETISDKEKVLFDCINKIKEKNCKIYLEKLRDDIRSAQDVNDFTLMKDLVGKYNEALRTIKG